MRGLLALALLPAAALMVPAPARAQSDAEAWAYYRPAHLQIALDRAGFGPGRIDNRPGVKTRAALADCALAWGRGEAETERLLLESVTAPFTRYTVTAADLAAVGRWDEDWEIAATLPAQAFGSLQEALAEKFHASEAFLALLNPQVADWSGVAAGTELIVPAVGRRRLREKAERLRVDCRRFRIAAYAADGRLLCSFPCSIARDRAKVPEGELRVVVFAPNPTYVFDPANYPANPRAREIGRKLILPAGPNCAVGVYWLGLSQSGYGVHGTRSPATVGSQESGGCFRLANWDVLDLADIIREGTPVLLTGLDAP